jgi:polyhydroxyalkanoate synthase
METRGGFTSAGPESQASAMFAEQRRIWRRVLSLPRVLELALGTRVGTTPHDVIFERGTLRLLRYRRKTPAIYSEPVLFCYALINRPYILDLQPDKSIVARYLEAGFEVYMIDWGVPSPADRGLSLESYVCVLLREVVEIILQAHRLSDLHLLGYCMGGTMGALLAALEPSLVRTLTLLAAPIDFGARDSLLSLWTDPKHFDVDAFIETHGNCPAWFLQSCFTLMKPVQNLLAKNLAFYESMDDPRLVTDYFAMERWINDNIPVAGETFREFVKKLYQRDELVRGELYVGNRRVDLGRITCPLLLLTATNDHLVPPPSTEGIRAKVGSRTIRSMTIDAGHVGLVVGGKAHRSVWPEATRWLANLSKPSGEE